MRITQGRISKSINDFPFLEIYKLDDYKNNLEPCAFFGMYRYEDICIACDNDAPSKILWTGQDALNFPWDEDYFWSTQHVTAHPKVKNFIESKSHPCELVKPSTFLVEHKPQQLGNKIYAYCPYSAPDYHGKKIIDELRCGGYEVIIGDGQWTQDQWRNSHADFHYNQCYIGLCLSDFAGGGTSIIEMGLRGMKVVTNVFNLPNCISWNSIHDIRLAIELESKHIGRTIPSVARYTWEALDHTHDWLEI